MPLSKLQNHKAFRPLCSVQPKSVEHQNYETKFEQWTQQGNANMGTKILALVSENIV